MIYLAFPAMGKSPLALKNSKYLDLDFGLFRTALGVDKSQESKLLSPFAKLMKEYENIGYIVLSNEPKLMQKIRVSKVFLPKNLKFAAKKMKVSEEQIRNWVSGWAQMAKKFGVPVLYLNVGLDHYLK